MNIHSIHSRSLDKSEWKNQLGAFSKIEKIYYSFVEIPRNERLREKCQGRFSFEIEKIKNNPVKMMGFSGNPII